MIHCRQMRKLFAYRGGKFVEITKDEVKPIAPYVYTDTMDATEHPCDGNVYESKSRFRAVTKAHGCMEIGNDLLSEHPKERVNNITDKHIAEALNHALEVHGWKD